ncbi:porin [Marinomonas mediterranea]|jgi:Outer membrane protein (porin)|uniref:Porin Gram-negative type n=1 Tax=Marinomonas mediterranea (strain ATCC 700492 / JCM 21426 / NBRC 103028 / MMB-1) TaxID=717774 RepID=F2K1H5_MARM1|nr:porin [Marinomonas mediterranea]ADZ92205.1 porin Gram-negative type [Marinomonas mediterranea MMB-1]WCN18266.1 porin [Marinomonas mediterranea MMB-1]
MKKSIIALAVSGAALASASAFAADEVTFTPYGNIQLVYADSDANHSEIKDNGSTFGFKGETKVKDDLTAFFKYELEADADEKTNDIAVNLDQAYLGVKGSMGKVQVGTFDSIYNNAIQDGVDQLEYIGISGAATTAEGDTIAYFSPSMSGFEVQLSAQVKGKADDDVQAAETATVKAGTTEDGTALTFVAKYSVDALTVAFGYDSLDNVNGAEETMGLSAEYKLNEALSLRAKYEENDDVDSRFGLGARYAYGTGDVYGSYQNVDPDSGNSYDEYAIGATYNVASTMYVYAELGQVEASEDDVTALGATYVF